jgi:hypothetical protein
MITTKLYLMKQLYTATLTLLITVITTALQAQVTLSANGPGDTYALIESKGFGVESPDCRHTSFGPHITEVFDNTLNKYVFVFHSHPVEDDDRCGADDRVRIEIKGGNGSPADLQHTSGQTAYYRWKFHAYLPDQGHRWRCRRSADHHHAPCRKPGKNADHP